MNFLQTFDTKAVIVACGTASAVALPRLDGVQSQGCIGVVTAACERAARVTVNGKIGVIGTAATVYSNAYRNALHGIDSAYAVTSIACPLFVPLVENGRIHRGDIVAETVVREYLAPLRDSGVDTLILGCTHYPLLTNLIAAEMGAQVTLIDAGHEAALATLEVLRKHDGLADLQGLDRYFVSDSAPDFAALASLFLQEDIGEMVEIVRL